MPSRLAVSRAASASAISSGSSSGLVSAAIASRDSLSARAGAGAHPGDRRVVAVERAEVPADEGELLREPVVEVARDAAALLEDCRLRDLLPVRANLLDGREQDRDVEREPEEVAEVDPVGVHGGVEEVVEAGERPEHGRDGEPRHELVPRALRLAGEPDRGEHQYRPIPTSCAARTVTLPSR